jgi:hypothetical protein
MKIHKRPIESRFNAVFLPVFVLLLAGCATAPALHTASGRPEVTLHGRTIQQVRTTVINHFVNQGWAPVQTEGNQLVFEREGSHGQKLVMGLMTNNPQATNRITITLIDDGSDVRVVGAVAAVGANNFGGAKVVELTGKGYSELQGELESIKAQTESSG